MNTNLDDLRAVLRDRAEQAPDAAPLLESTHAGVRRRRQRRKVTGALGVTAGVLVVAGVAATTLHGTGSTPKARAADGATAPATSAAVRQATQYYTALPLPFTVTPPAGYLPSTWVADPAKSMLWFDKGTDDKMSVDVLYGTHKPGGITGSHPATVNGKPAIAGLLSSQTPQARILAWQIDPGHWAYVEGMTGVSAAEVQAIANTMTTTPSTQPTHLKVPVVPGWELGSWNFGGNAGDTTPELVDVCPNGTDLSQDYDDVGMPAPCVDISTWPADPAKMPPGMPKAPVNPEVTQVVRQLGPKLWVRVKGTNANAAVIKQVAAGITAG